MRGIIMRGANLVLFFVLLVALFPASAKGVGKRVTMVLWKFPLGGFIGA
jgi:hypothetical protein|tara:strand:+ start:615 stop:761 length:147 start_codon:yes stop_codon:yes gene_type:complete